MQLNNHVRGLVAEHPQHPRHQIGACGLAAPHPQMPAPQAVEVFQRPAGLVALAQNTVTVAQQHPTGLGELGAATTAVKQADVELFLQVLHLEAHGGLAHVEAVGGPLEAAFPGNGPEDAQLIQAEWQVVQAWLLRRPGCGGNRRRNHPSGTAIPT